MYQYVLFDLDGTLTDPGIGITNSVAYALKKWNIELAERSELYKFIGPPLEESFRKYYGFSEEDALKAVEYYSRAAEAGEVNAIEALERLKNELMSPIPKRHKASASSKIAKKPSKKDSSDSAKSNAVEK